jgi:3-oxoacyl-[acyl-carrier protein] reductase
MKLLEGRTAVVTGAVQGIGLAIATTCAQHGASVMIADVNPDGLPDARAAVEACGARAAAMQVDVRDPHAMARLVDTTVEQFGALDIFVNNAGITRDATLRNMTLEDFEIVVDVHLKGTWLGVKEAARVMREQKRGAIVNISSVSGKIGLAGQTNYSAAKAGIVGLTKAAAKELAHHGIRVNAIQPGLIRTAMTLAMPEHIYKEREAEIPLGRAGEPQDIANAVLFLASDLSSFITGTVLEVNGGRVM